MATCKICGHASTKLFSKVILKKYAADYFKCVHCDFLQTSEPVWIKEAYSSAITSLDIGLISRNVKMRHDVTPIINACFSDAATMLDYAGGYGAFVRLMRDSGFNFYRQDPYCENLFAKHFDCEDISPTKFDLLTAFEVFEHFVNPMAEIEALFKLSPHLIFSTELLPTANNNLGDWWYISPETGQHVAFYSTATLEYIAAKFGKNYYSKNNSLHIFTSKSFDTDQIDYALRDVRTRPRWFGLRKKALDFHIERPSLLARDFEYIRNIINASGD